MAKKSKLNQPQKATNRAEDYLFGHRDDAVLDLALELNERKINKIIPELKKELSSYVEREVPNFEGQINMTGKVYEILKNFDTKIFLNREWKHVPYNLKQKDFEAMQGCLKQKIYVKRYDYNAAIFDFYNKVAFSDEKRKILEQKEVLSSDVQYYLSNDEKMLFAKLTSLKFKPVSLKFLGTKLKGKTEEESRALLSNKDLYNRFFNIAQYILLEGDPQKAVPYMRYDNDGYPHTNVYIGYDPRRNIFGDSAQSPHFHFQNEDDVLLCLRKFKSADDKIKYRTGRCNAIDCSHLKKYLLKLDAMDNDLIEQALQNGENYGMPFLKMKFDKKILNIDLEQTINSYMTSFGGGSAKLSEIDEWLEGVKEKGGFQENSKSFSSLISSLDFLEFITTLSKTKMDCQSLKALSDLEIEVASRVVNAINQNNENILLNDGKPKYQIETEFERDRN